MKTLTVFRSNLSGTVKVPASKSLAHRAIIASALADGCEDRIGFDENDILSDDISITRQAMRDLLAGKKEIFCGESGSTVRFLIPLAAALGREVVFSGSGRLPERPLGEYADAFRGRGVRLAFPPEDKVFLPLSLSGRLEPGIFELPGDVSSQYVTGLLLALPLLDGDSEIKIRGDLESSAYVDLTLEVMEAFGVRAQKLLNPIRFIVPGGQEYRQETYELEGDYSSAAFWCVANYLGADIFLEGLNPLSKQGDRKILDLLSELEGYRSGIETLPPHQPYFEIDASQIPDLVPVLALACAATNIRSKISNASRLRIKESNRILSTVMLINSVGGDAHQTNDGLVIEGREGLFPGGEVHSFADHRIAMSAAIAGVHSQRGVTIKGYEAVSKSYPDFFGDLRKLGGKTDEFDLG